MKKKKKSLHIRRIRPRSDTKEHKFNFSDIIIKFNDFFYKEFYYEKKNYYSFILKIAGLRHNYIQNYFKNLGFPLNYRIKIKTKKHNFFFKNNKKVYNFGKNYKKTNLIKLVFLSMFKNLKNEKIVRTLNVNFKQKLCLHFSYKHMLFLPVRGQRTKTNAKIRKNYGII